MYSEEATRCESGLDEIWQSHRESVRRMLIGLTRDIDLADDLLQETYLNAQNGIAAYRGEGARAWLAAIARNAFNAHVRRRYVQSEIPMDCDDAQDNSHPGSPSYIDLLSLRQAISALPDALRTALMMKHYGGFTYQEIARDMECAVGTAKWRVNEALSRLRSALAGDGRMRKMECPCNDRLLDYVYGMVQGGDAEKIRLHLRDCPKCREQADELRHLTRSLDALEGDFRMMHIVELEADGTATLYVTVNDIHTGDAPLRVNTFDAEKHSALAYLSQRGDELSFVKEQSAKCDHRFTYTFDLAFPVEVGQVMDLLCVFQPARSGTHESRDGVCSFQWRQAPGEHETVYVQVICLPRGAELVSAQPEPHHVQSNGATTVAWRTLLPPYTQFDCTVDYRMKEPDLT